MATPDARRFRVFCRHCEQLMLTAPILRDPELALIEAHLRACLDPDPLARAPRLADLLWHVRVEPAEPGER